jgi:hypothetical protein
VTSDDTTLVTAGVLAEAYGVTDEEIAAALRSITHRVVYPPTGEHVHFLIEAAVSVAAAHVHCSDVGCGTCEEIADGLVLVMALLRIRMERQLEVMVDPVVAETAGMVGIGKAAPPDGSYHKLRAAHDDVTGEIEIDGGDPQSGDTPTEQR